MRRSAWTTILVLGHVLAVPASLESQVPEFLERAAKKLGAALSGGADSVVADIGDTGPAPLGVTPEERLLGPVRPGRLDPNSIFVSPDGERVLITAERGSRKVMLLEGVEGPVFDDVGGIALGWTVEFSESGGRSAYIGRRGSEYVGVVDGSEVGTLFHEQLPVMPPGSSSFAHHNKVFHFSRDGSRLAYPSRSPQGEWRMVVDGEAGPAFAQINVEQIRVRGDRVIYVGMTATRKYRVVVDGTAGPDYDEVTSLLVSDDGRHYAFVGKRDGAVHLIRNGVEGPAGPPPGAPILAPDGRLAYVTVDATRAGSRAETPSEPLIVDGVEVTDRPGHIQYDGSVPGGSGRLYPIYGTTNPSEYRHFLAFSPDGERFAYVTHQHPAPGLRVVIDGQPGPEYNAIKNLHFSADGSRVAYVGSVTSGSFMVVDGQELPGRNPSHFGFSPDGGRYWYQAAQDGGVYLILDREESGPYSPQGGDLVGEFSPDGSSFAFVGCQGYLQCELKLNGQVQVQGRIGDFSARDGLASGRLQPTPAIVFSPDGNRLAYVAESPGVPGGQSVFLDGASLGVGGLFGNPIFSPDSGHFAFAAWKDQTWQIVVDGRLGPSYPTLVQFSPKSMTFVDDDTLRLLAVKDGAMYRVVMRLDD